jgi:hypothetical protein
MLRGDGLGRTRSVSIPDTILYISTAGCHSGGFRVQLPFSIEEFLAVFRAYNVAVWPGQVALYLLGVALISLALRGFSRWGIAGGLALLWAWMGAVYHLAFFSAINPAARLFGGAFLLQAGLWIVWARRAPGLKFRPSDASRRFAGWALLGYAFIVYPILNVALGHEYPTMPTFGAPCPTTIATLGLLTWATPRPPWFVWLVPVLWAVVGTSAAFTLGVREDLGLLAAAILAIAAQLTSRRAAAPA